MLPGVSLVVHLFLPHHSNNHRPKTLHIDTLLVYLLLFSLFNLSVKLLHREFPDVLGYATDIRVERLLSATNEKRAASGQPPLSLNGRLSAAAAGKAQDMFAKNYWAHNSPSGASPWSFIVSAGYRYTVAGENLAKNFQTSESVVEAWMASPTHRDNILKGQYREVGFAVVNGVLGGEETTLVVQMFGAPAAGTAVSEAPRSPIIPEVAAVSEEASSQPIASAFTSVSKKPVINIVQISREVAFGFMGVMMAILILDAWLVSRRRTVRIAGHNIAHFLLFAALFLAAGAIERGSLL